MGLRELFRTVGKDFAFYESKSLPDKLMTYYFNLEFRLLLNCRICNYLANSQSFLRKLLPFYIKKQHHKYGSIISPFARIGNNVRFAHANGIMMGPVIIGNNVTIFHQVTLGSHGRLDTNMAYPVIEDNVKIYAGAKIIGGITIGHDSVIGANVVLTRSVPPFTLVVSPEARKVTDENGIRFL